MAFKITQSRPRKVQKSIAAFSTADDEVNTPGSSSSKAADALLVSANQWVEKGTGYAEAGDPAAALRCWDQAALINPSNGQLHEMRAQVLNDLGRTFEAVQAAQQAVRYRPEWPEGHITLARVQLNLGEPQLALASYQAAGKLRPGHPDLIEELPRAQMLAKLHKQRPTGTRAYVVDEQSGAEGSAAVAAARADAAATAGLAASSQAAAAAAPAAGEGGEEACAAQHAGAKEDAKAEPPSGGSLTAPHADQHDNTAADNLGGNGNADLYTEAATAQAAAAAAETLTGA